MSDDDLNTGEFDQYQATVRDTLAAAGLQSVGRIRFDDPEWLAGATAEQLLAKLGTVSMGFPEGQVLVVIGMYRLGKEGEGMCHFAIAEREAVSEVDKAT